MARSGGYRRLIMSELAKREQSEAMGRLERDALIAQLEGRLLQAEDEVMLAQAEAAEAAPPEQEDESYADFYGSQGETGDGGQPQDNNTPYTIEMALAYQGNLADLLDEHELEGLGRQVVREYEIDEAARGDWMATAKDALEAAAQRKPADKNYPYPKASNVKYPLLTTACIQFAARAYPAIVRGDEVVDAKPLGEDKGGEKSKRAARSTAFVNDQIIYRCTEWETGTDALLHALPAVGAGFRKVYWDDALKRPRIDYVSALDVVMPFDAPSMELTPRITHKLKKYPYEVDLLKASETWGPHDINADASDSQKQIEYLEQVCYRDLDGDGLSEPYIVTVHKETSKVVRIDPAFDAEDVLSQRYVDHDGQQKTSIARINRMMPWVDYMFLPDPQGGAYGMGFGQLLQSLSATIDTTINELIDAGHWANTNAGFLSSEVKLRPGENISLVPNEFKTLPGAMNMKEAVYRMEFPGPNQTLFNLLEFLITAAKDITSVKDVLTGDAPGSQPATSTLALIEQGLQVFSAIYKRIYRAMTREFEMVYRLNARYLSDDDYNKFLDAQPPMAEINEPSPMGGQGGPSAGIGHNGGPPMLPTDMGAPAAETNEVRPTKPSGEVVPFPRPGDMGGEAAALPNGVSQPPQGVAPQLPSPTAGPLGPEPGAGQHALAQQIPQPQQRPSARVDFNLDDLDIRPVADPTAVTEMQRLARANALLQFKTDPTCNAVEINKRAFEAMRVPEPEKLIVESNPLLEQQAQAQTAMAVAQAQAAEAAVALTQAQTQAALLDPQLKQQDMELKRQDMGLKERQITQADAQIAVEHTRLGIEQANLEIATHTAAMDEAERGMRLELERDKTTGAIDAAREANTLQQVKALSDQKLGRDQTMLELRRILTEAEQKRADRQQQARDAAEDRTLKREDIASREKLDTKKIDAQKDVAKEAAKARAQQRPSTPR